MRKVKNNKPRKGCKDLWNAFMVNGADFTENDIPICPTTALVTPSKIITYSEAKTNHSKKIREDKDYFFDSFVCFYEDDQNFDGLHSGIWYYPRKSYNILKHFKGIITPDFSTYQDFPEALKKWNTYRMRAFGYWYGTICNKQVINNVRWGTEETYDYCFDGIEEHSIVAIGTVGGSPYKLLDRDRFEKGLFEMVKRVKPRCIIVYGSASYPCFEKLKKEGTLILQFDSRTASFYKGRRNAI